MTLNQIKSIYFIGIEGISMRGLAEYFRQIGAQVSGSDVNTTGHQAENIRKLQPRPDLVIISSAITRSSAGWVEVEAAQERDIPVKGRAWLIGELMRQKGAYGIAIAGAHGKSTTTAMLGQILVEAGYDPLILCGAIMSEYDGSVRIPDWIKHDKIPASPAGRRMQNVKSSQKSLPRRPAGEFQNNSMFDIRHYIVAEACEYEKQFLQFAPRVAVITNIDKEHLDSYPRGWPQITRVFRDFIKLVPDNGLAVVNGDDRHCQAIAKSANCRVKFFRHGQPWPGLQLKLIGDFNQMNATAAARVAHELGVDHQTIKQSLNAFQGIARRLEYKGQVNAADLFDDYAHHPSEIQATLAAVRLHFPSRRMIVIFQPHQFLRTKQLLTEFRQSFTDADVLYLAPIQAVTGRDDQSVITSESFAETIDHPNKMMVDGAYDQIARVVYRSIRPKDIVITMGATSINQVADFLIN